MLMIVQGYGERQPKFVTWKDAENALNAPWNHVITVIDDFGKRMDLDMVEEPWFYKQVPRKKELFELANNGYTIHMSVWSGNEIY